MFISVSKVNLSTFEFKSNSVLKFISETEMNKEIPFLDVLVTITKE